jgi:hypothetical protein
MATIKAVVINPGAGGSSILTLLMSDGTSMPISALSVSQDGVADPTQPTKANPLPVADLDLRIGFERVVDLLSDANDLFREANSAPALTFRPSFNPFNNSVANIVKNASGTLYSLSATNRNTSTRWLQLFASPTIPTANTTPYAQYMVPPGPGMIVLGSDFFTTAGIVIPGGIAYGFSTSSTAYTAATATDHDFSALFL